MRACSPRWPVYGYNYSTGDRRRRPMKCASRSGPANTADQSEARLSLTESFGFFGRADLIHRALITLPGSRGGPRAKVDPTQTTMRESRKKLSQQFLSGQLIWLALLSS